MRGFGELEAVVMDRLWRRGRPASVRDVLGDLAPDRVLAYNTILTVLDNLYKKGWLTREKSGRAHLFRPVCTREEYGARLMRAVLDDSGDRGLALLRLVGTLSPEETAALRLALAAHEDWADS